MRDINRSASDSMDGHEPHSSGSAGVVFALKRPYCGAVNGGAAPRSVP